MIQISNELKNKLNTSTSIKVKNKIVVGTTEYDGSVIKTYPKLSHKNSSVFGGFPAKTCSFELYNHNNDIDFENKEIKLYKGIEVSGSIEWILQGIFIPRAKDIETNITSKTISFNNIQDKTQLFDVSYNSDLSWDNNVTHTGLEIIQEICTKLSIDLSSNTFNLSSYSFKQPNFAENITCREVISRFAEIAGCIAFINREGKLEIKAPTNTSSTIERNRYIKLTKENEVSFNTLVLGKDGINDDIVYPETIATDRVEYKILDNPFVDLYREEMIEDISVNITGKSYIPFTLNNFVDGFCFDLNDVISVKDRNGNTLNLTILNYEIANRISANVSAETVGTMTTDYNLAGSNKSSLNRVKIDVDHNKEEISALVEKVDENTSSIASLVITTGKISSTVSQTTKEQNEKISEITQNVDEINSKISYIADITTSGESQQASVSLKKVNESEPIAIKIHPISEDISYLYPSNFLYPADDLYPTNRIIRFTNTDTNEVVDYELPDDLLYYDANNYDEFILNYDSQTCSIIKKVEYDKTTGKNKIKSGTETVNYEYPTIALTDGDYIISLPGYSNAYLYVQLMASNIYTTQFATKVEVKSSIKQTADAINLEVSKKVDESEVISSINLSSEDATIKANKIKFEGLVTANKNFKILADGSIEAKNASLSGNVYLPDGGKVVGGDGMMSVMIVNGNLWGQQFAGASGFVPLGFETFVDQNSNFKTVANAMILEFMIPSNFKPKKAFIYLRHIPTQNSYDSSGNKITGYSKNIKAYINSGNFYRDIDWTTQKFTISGSYSEISNCFGSSGFTGSSSGIKEGTSIDITNLIKNTGTYSIKLQSSYNSDDSYADTGCVLAQLYIYGYTSENIS